GVPDEGLPAPEVDTLVQRRANAGHSALPLQLSGNDARVIEHQHVACPKELGEIAYLAVLERAFAASDQHTRRITRARGAQSDAFRRQFEVEQIDAHDRPLRQFAITSAIPIR